MPRKDQLGEWSHVAAILEGSLCCSHMRTGLSVSMATILTPRDVTTGEVSLEERWGRGEGGGEGPVISYEEGGG